MKNNRIRSLIILIGIILIISFLIGTIIYFIRHGKSAGTHRDSTVRPDQAQVIPIDSCPRPKSYSSNYDFDYKKRRNEYRNTDAPVDYFHLSLSWSPTYCEVKQHENSFQCQHSFGFIVHGLWPSTRRPLNVSQKSHQHRRNCRNEEQLPIELINKYYCIMPSEFLIQSEWEKHGTCYWKTSEEYFEQIRKLFSKINLPNNLSDILNDQSISKHLRRDAIKQEILNLNPQLLPRQIDVQVINHGRKLKDISFCYDLNFNHINCY